MKLPTASMAKYWLWVATSNQVCVLLLAPTRSSAELKQLLGENFEGFSAVIAHTPTIRRPPPPSKMSSSSRAGLGSA